MKSRSNSGLHSLFSIYKSVKSRYASGNKPVLLSLLILLGIQHLTFNISHSQTPQAFKYQAVVRDTSGSLIANQTIGIRASIVADSAGGSTVYQETHTPMANSFGLINLAVGNGSPTVGTFNTIDWGAGDHFLQIEMDASGGANYLPLSVAQMMSVPYALFAENVAWEKDGNNLVYSIPGTGGAEALLSTDGADFSNSAFKVGSNVQLRSNGNSFLAGGNVGVGLLSPAEKLHVIGSIRMVDGNQEEGYIPVSDSNGTMVWSDPEVVSPAYWTANGNDIYNTNSGHIGIGTSSPAFVLDIADSTAIVSVSDIDNSSQIGLIAPGDGYLGGVGTGSNHDLSLFTGNTNRMLITAAGEVGIATATPDSSAQLDIASNDKGILIPRMTTAQIEGILSPANGLQVYNTDVNCLYVYSGDAWKSNCAYIGNNATLPDPIPEWTEKSFFPNMIRFEAVGFAIGDKGYYGTGRVLNITNFKDFWEYDPATDTWTQKADFGGTARYGAVGFAIGNKGYVGTGNDSLKTNDFWEYDPATDTWTQKAGFAGTARDGGAGFSIGNKGYLGLGFNDTIHEVDFWEYDPATDAWTQKANFAGFERSHAVGFSLEGKGYIGTGEALFSIIKLADFWEYDPDTDSWEQTADYGFQNTRGVAFSIPALGKAYASGVDPDTLAFFEFDPSPETVHFITVTPNGTAEWQETVWQKTGVDLHNKNEGNIGIGTDSPSEKLEVTGNVSASGNIITHGEIRLHGDGNIRLNGNWLSYDGTDKGVWVKGNGNVGIGTDNPTSKLTVDGSIRAVTGGGSQYLEIDHLNTSIAMNFVGSGGMRFQNSGTTQMTLTNAGNLGIGATSPQAMLHVDGNSQFDGDSWFDGNVGIGTGSPNQKLHVHNGHIEISNNNDPVLLFRDGGDNRMMSLRYTRNDDQMEFRNDAGSTVMAIEYWGKVGLGTIYPDEHLHIYKGDDPTLKLQSDGNDEVSGRISLRQDNETGMDIYYDGRSGTDDLVFESYSRGTNNGQVILINGDGATAFGTTNRTHFLTVNGDAAKPGGGNWSTFSDARLKKNVEPYTDGLTQLLQIDPVSFQYNKTSGLKDTDARYIGIIAQDMLEIAPYMVETIGENATADDKTDLDGYYSYDGTALTYMLVNAVKEQQAIIDTLMDKNEFLETELQAIKAQLGLGEQAKK